MTDDENGIKIPDTSDQMPVREDDQIMTRMILIIEWMYAKGWPMFGRDKEIEEKILCIENALIPRLGMKGKKEKEEGE